MAEFTLGGKNINYELPSEECTPQNAMAAAESAHYALMQAQQKLYDKYPDQKNDIDEQLRHSGAAFGASMTCGPAAINMLGVANEVIYPRNYSGQNGSVFAADTNRDFKNNTLGFTTFSVLENSLKKDYDLNNDSDKKAYRNELFQKGVTNIYKNIMHLGPTRP